MKVHTRSQKLAQEAYARIEKHGTPRAEFVTFAKKFPALIHTCGLAQAVAFALAKQQCEYVNDLSEVLRAAGHLTGQKLDEQARTADVAGYLRLSRDAMDAASWLKRYVEAARPEVEDAGEDQ